jgi:hypothetical protein
MFVVPACTDKKTKTFLILKEMHTIPTKFPYIGDFFISVLAYVAWRAGTTTQCRSELYPPSQGIWLQVYCTYC